MNRTITILTGALAAQVLLTGVTWWPSDDAPAAEPLIAIAAGEVDRLRIWPAPEDGAEVQPVELVRGGDGWTIASAGGYPADPDKVDKVLDALAEARVSDPLAATAASHASLSVSERGYGKKVELSAGDESAVVYLGAGSGRSASARRDGEDAVYAIRGLSQWAVGARARDYYDPVYLETDPETIEQLTLRWPDRSLVLEKVEGQWRAGDEALDAEAVEAVLEDAATLRIAALPEEPPPLDGGLRVEWTRDDGGQSVTEGFVIGPERDGKHPALADGRDHAVLVSAYAVEDLLSADPEALKGEDPSAE